MADGSIRVGAAAFMVAATADDSSVGRGDQRARTNYRPASAIPAKSAVSPPL
jgi:hypothetical protein